MLLWHLRTNYCIRRVSFWLFFLGGGSSTHCFLSWFITCPSPSTTQYLFLPPFLQKCIMTTLKTKMKSGNGVKHKYLRCLHFKQETNSLKKTFNKDVTWKFCDPKCFYQSIPDFLGLLFYGTNKSICYFYIVTSNNPTTQ